MKAPRLVLITGISAALSLSGCGIALSSKDLPNGGHPAATAIPSASPSRTLSDGPDPNLIPTDELTCQPVSRSLLSYLERVGNVGDAVRYPEGQMVAYGNGWWAVVVRRSVKKGSGYDAYPPFAYFDTTAPSATENEKAKAREVRGDTAQHDLAEKCLG